jgi:hypothetical protein
MKPSYPVLDVVLSLWRRDPLYNSNTGSCIYVHPPGSDDGPEDRTVFVSAAPPGVTCKFESWELITLTA